MNVYNTLTRRKDELRPLREGEVRMYVCGVTVYDLSHIGHARSAIVFDVMRSYLQFKGYRVTFVKNFTDVDDKIIRRANEEGVSAHDLSERYIAAYRDDMAALGVRPPDHEPRATEHIPDMIVLIERLLAGGFAYVVDGDVYFEVRRFSSYGRLSGRNLEELLVGARVEVDERKRDPRDFALWKAAKPGEPSWESPWGPGRPGWHIECSAMSMRYLGESFDLHGGGEDLIFPHHECEIAQSEAGTGKPFVCVWVHNGFVNLGAEKMSKSLGNILTVRSLTEHFHEDAIRYYLLQAHYRSPIEFSRPRLDRNARAIGRLRNLIKSVIGPARERQIATQGSVHQRPDEISVRQRLLSFHDPELKAQAEAAFERFVKAMDDDFGTSEAVGELFKLSNHLFSYRDQVDRKERDFTELVAGVDVMWMLGQTLGLFYRHVDPYVPSPERTAELNLREQQAAQLLAERNEAKKRHDWKAADALRTQIESLGAKVEDTASGPRLIWTDQ